MNKMDLQSDILRWWLMVVVIDGGSFGGDSTNGFKVVMSNIAVKG